MTSKLLPVLFMLTLFCQAQEQGDYSAIILSLEGDGELSRSSQKSELEFPQRFMPGDVITIKNGSAVVMLFSGEEIALSAVSDYTVPTDNTDYNSSLSAMANRSSQNLLTQSGAAYVLRKPGILDLFPQNSKVFDKNNIILRTNTENPDKALYRIEIKDERTQKVIYKADSLKGGHIHLSDIEYITGRTYYWNLRDLSTNESALGTIVFPVSNEIEYTTLESNFDYINAISELYSKKYYFDAYALVLKAMEEYPNQKIYPYMKLRIAGK